MGVDTVVLATHRNQTLALLTDAADQERRILRSFEYTTSLTLLHTDSRVLSKASGARASWNYRMADCESDDRGRGQPSPEPVAAHRRRRRLPGALNDEGTIPQEAALHRMSYAHPTYTTRSVAAQSEVAALRDGRTPFVATLQGSGNPATLPAVVGSMLRWPLLALRTSLLIRWQGIRLRARGIPVQPRPADATGDETAR